MNVCLVLGGLQRLDGLKHGQRLWLRSWWRVIGRRDKNQAGLAAVVGGTLEQQEVLKLGLRRGRWRRGRRGRGRGRQRNQLQAAGCLNHKVVLRGVGRDVKCWLGHNQAALVS